MNPIEELEDELSRPSEADVEFLRHLEGDILILGAAGKMGPSLARLCRRAADAAGPGRRIVAVSRRLISEPGIDALACDLLDRAQVAQLPACPNVLYLAGRKFGSSDSPELTWAMNTVVPANVAERFRPSRIVVFSTGNVYPLRAAGGRWIARDRPAGAGGRVRADPVSAANASSNISPTHHGLRCLFFRLNYAVDLRYGVLVDIARKVHAGDPVDLTVPAFNVIWQRDANSYALRALGHCATPPRILNITGLETVAVRDAAEFFAARFARPCRFQGAPGPVALLSDASAAAALMGPPAITTAAADGTGGRLGGAGGASLNKPTHFEVADGKF